jgi:hypothetical protein
VLLWLTPPPLVLPMLMQLPLKKRGWGDVKEATSSLMAPSLMLLSLVLSSLIPPSLMPLSLTRWG